MCSNLERVTGRRSEREDNHALPYSASASLPALGAGQAPRWMSVSAADSQARASDFVVKVAGATCSEPTCQ
jgi:hypothetical protein